MRHLFIFGTRPEAIKMAPLIKTFQADSKQEVFVCVTGQHREMLDQVLEFFEIKPDFDLNLMSANQTLYDVTAKALLGLKPILDKVKPDNIFVQGDTTTAFVGALAGFYEKIKVSHIEAGLRSGDMHSPFPEEGNRILAGHLSAYHFAPTPRAVENLNKEGVTQHVYNVGNTVIDALLLGLEIIKRKGEAPYETFFKDIDFSKKVVLVTGHRRESFGGPFENMCRAMRDIALAYPDVQMVYPVHLNPNVRKTVNEVLHGVDNVKLIEPLAYPYLIWLMSKSFFVLTDSGGIQEEAPSLGKPVLVMRDVTERQEGIEAGTAMLVGTSYEIIVREAKRLLDDKNHYETMANAVNPYGDGTTSKQVLAFFNKI
ncbi:UDP-N-acetylglucosamine 2-epimerase (non-hydrolyzing) [Cytophagales bacterium LB-30]|uniref:UDP-N-acetylglucosamine 2-epimerase (non-hydrolyzing) n=1 Tax=Shiella aurantiaca TaxID=3058365 RepID=A0ABT8F2E3_9BACT|nr:UDP-N-acetylglucosamine 2-epimerase (non-hydrolyzing) [Shiella aurantiaca]MDN4164623.1 UDP-N-acetylglucosamine 2-epimerase (non-hydrolyzing) [Shiella aurantiaca]